MISLYHIAVRMNCFIPSSYITTVTRGDSEYGEEVGHFECVYMPMPARVLMLMLRRNYRMGISLRKPTVVVDGYERMVDTVLAKGGSRSLVRVLQSLRSHVTHVAVI